MKDIILVRDEYFFGVRGNLIGSMEAANSAGFIHSIQQVLGVIEVRVPLAFLNVHIINNDTIMPLGKFSS